MEGGLLLVLVPERRIVLHSSKFAYGQLLRGFRAQLLGLDQPLCQAFDLRDRVETGMVHLTCLRVQFPSLLPFLLARSRDIQVHQHVEETHVQAARGLRRAHWHQSCQFLPGLFGLSTQPL